MMVWLNRKHVGAFIAYLNVSFNVLKEFNCALVGQIKDLIQLKYLGSTDGIWMKYEQLRSV